MGQPKGGKGGGKGQKSGGKSGGDKGGKAGQKSGKNEQKSEKKGNNKSSSLVSLCLCVCLSIVYSIMIGYLGGAAIKTVGDNPQLLAMASDSRLKKNVRQVSYGLKELSQIEPKSYNYITENDKTTRHIGVMAQDLKNIMPELVVELDQHKFKDVVPENLRQDTVYGVKYQELVPVLINAIKELKEEVETLKQRVI
jgi:hypothetical protein